MLEIESHIVQERGVALVDVGSKGIRFSAYGGTHFGDVVRALVKHYPQRTMLGLTLTATQAFRYNAIFFTYALILTRFYGVPVPSVGWFILPFAASAAYLTVGECFPLEVRARAISIFYRFGTTMGCDCGTGGVWCVDRDGGRGDTVGVSVW